MNPPIYLRVACWAVLPKGAISPSEATVRTKACWQRIIVLSKVYSTFSHSQAIIKAEQHNSPSNSCVHNHKNGVSSLGVSGAHAPCREASRVTSSRE
eukprot:5429077-Amphidinium_carterae.1